MGSKFFGNVAKDSVSLIILIFGYIEAIMGSLQWLGLMPGHHPAFAFTGSFYNPGPYACYMAVSVPVAIYMMTNSNNRLIKWGALMLVILCSFLIPATLSRTAIVACILGTSVAMTGSSLNYLKKLRSKSINYVWCIMAVFGVIVALTTLYIIKKDSADGRFLIWKVATQAANDVPLNGMGWDNVAGTYGEAQERYFASGERTAQEIMVADAPEYVFNEYLQIAIAFGPLAALAMIAIIGSALAVALKSKSYGFAGSTVAIAIVMFASYPLQFPLFVVTISIVLIGCFLSSKCSVIKIAGSVIVVLCTVLFLCNDDRTDVNSSFQIAHSLHRQRNYIKSNEMLLDLKQKSSDPMILNIIGKNYQSLGMVDSAEYYLNKSTFRCPNRMYPHYLLMKLYNDSTSFNRELCRKEAEKILSMKVKIESPAINDMRREAHLILNGSE